MVRVRQDRSLRANASAVLPRSSNTGVYGYINPFRIAKQSSRVGDMTCANASAGRAAGGTRRSIAG
jgi:hypothetical protein